MLVDKFIPEINMTIDQIITNKGYHLQIHFTTTSDGYVLKMYRILPKKLSKNKVVLLQHGLFDSSDSWIVNKEMLCIPFILSKLGYDVWLGNNRGNKHSRGHIKLNPDKDKKYWEFSFHEMGIYDLPAIIDYILKLHKINKLTYIGHSQGTAQLFVGLTILPDYFKSKLNGFIALGPITSLNNLKSNFLKVSAEYRLDSLFSLLGINEIFPSPDSIHKFTALLCEKITSLCDGLLEILSDANPNVDDKESLLVFVSHFPSGASLQTLEHYGSIIRNKKFGKYDNEEAYDFNQIKEIPIALLVGSDDQLSTVEDNRILRNNLLELNLLHFYKEYENMGHATFFLNKKDDYIKDVIRCLKDFQK